MGSIPPGCRNDTSTAAAGGGAHRPEALAGRTLEAVRRTLEGTDMALQKAPRTRSTALYSRNVHTPDNHTPHTYIPDSHSRDNHTRHTLAPYCQWSIPPALAASLCA